MIRFHQERMRDADQPERQRSHWLAVVDAMQRALEGRES
jgi:hypothetical protein